MSVLRGVVLRPVLGMAARFGWAPTSLAAGVAATVVLSLSMNGTLAAWSATIKQTNNAANAGTLVMQETLGGVTCKSTDGTDVNTNSATCIGINHYGGATVVPGVGVATTVAVKNVGTVAANGFTITFAPCTQSNNTAANNVSGSATNLCDVMYMYIQVTVDGVTTPITPQASITLSAANSGGALALPAVPVGATAAVYFGVGLSGGAGNNYQGLTATQPFTFQFSS